MKPVARKRRAVPDEQWLQAWRDEINRYYKYLHDNLDFGDSNVLDELVAEGLFSDAERDEVMEGVNLYEQNTIFMRLMANLSKSNAKELIAIFAREEEETAKTLGQMYNRASRSLWGRTSKA